MNNTKRLLLASTLIPAFAFSVPNMVLAQDAGIRLAQGQPEQKEEGQERERRRPDAAHGRQPAPGGQPQQRQQPPQQPPAATRPAPQAPAAQERRETPPPPPAATRPAPQAPAAQERRDTPQRPAVQERRETPPAPPAASRPTPQAPAAQERREVPPPPPAAGRPAPQAPAAQERRDTPPVPSTTQRPGQPPAPAAQERRQPGQAPATTQRPGQQPPAASGTPPAPAAGTPPAPAPGTSPAPAAGTPPAPAAQTPPPAPAAGTPPPAASTTPPAAAPGTPPPAAQGRPGTPPPPAAAGAPTAPGQPPVAGQPQQPLVPPTAARPLPAATASGGGVQAPTTGSQGQPIRNVQDLRGERRETQDGNRTIIREGDRTLIREDGRFIIRHNEVDRFRSNARDVRTERQGRETTTIVERPDGSRIVTVVDDDGRLLRRSRRDRDNREVIIIDNRYRAGPEVRGSYFVDLPPPVIRIPRERYILEAERASPADVYDVLIAPPVERIDRRYTLDEIRYSPRVRERMPRVDIDTINFELGSWEITPDQIGRLAVIGDAIKRAVARNPAEVFLIEGHTDATGADVDNLSLSDRRAETVALALTEKFGVPAENLTTQGYGEQYLKIDTQAAERQNRRVSARRITPLLSGDQTTGQVR
jgi:outer membrane protein OmpA-like peptidoglycan-associated protein